MNGSFPYAAGYYPQMHPREEVPRDLDTMQRCGINLVRTGELFNSWDQMEPERGRFCFEPLDEFFDLCAERGMGVLLGTGTASPPPWLLELDPEVPILSSAGRRFPTSATYSWACLHNPAYLRESERYIRALAERYRDHPALWAYQIHNEIGLPFMSPTGEVEMYCHCSHTKARFREWLREKYGSLEALNRAWTWSATNPRHTSWEMAEPPAAKPTAWSSVTRYLDFRLFMMDSVAEFVRWQNRLLKELDPRHPTSVNTFYMKGEDKMSVLCGIDQFALAGCADYIGYDLYPGSSDKLETRPEFSSMFLDHARSVSRPLGKDWWLMEVESGPIGGWALGPHRDTSPGDIRRYILEALGHDAKLTLFQGFRQWDFQPLNWGGLVDLDGGDTGRTGAAAWAGDFCRRHGAFLQRARAPKGEAALLVSRENAVIANGMGHEDFLVQAIRAHYSLFWELGYQVDFITPELVESGYARDYGVISAPFLLSADRKLTGALLDYVRGGGVLIGEPRLSYVDGRGWYNHSWPAGELAQVFGVRQQGIQSGLTPRTTYRGKNYEGYWHKETLELRGGEKLASFFDDTPAVVQNQCGKGCGLYFATHALAARLENGSDLAWDVLTHLLAGRGIQPRVRAEYANRLNRELDPHLLMAGDQTMVILTTFLKRGRGDFYPPGGKEVRMTLRDPRPVLEILDLTGEREIPFRQHPDRVEFTLRPVPGEQPVLMARYRGDTAPAG